MTDRPPIARAITPGSRTDGRTDGLTKKGLTTRDKLALSIARDERGLDD